MNSRPKHRVLFDDTCGLCNRQMRLLGALDWLHLFAPVPIAQASKLDLPDSISHEDLQNAIHCFTRDGRVFRGAQALRFIGLRLPLLTLAALLVYLPGMLAVSAEIYRRVSQNRHTLSQRFNRTDGLPPAHPNRDSRSP